MGFFDWKPEYSVGIAKIDQQHRKLVSLVDQLFEAMKAGKGNDVLGRILTELVNYTVVHFETEEKLMTEYNYPAYASHKLEHEHLTKRAVALKTDFDAGNAVLSSQVSNFLKEWLINHIQKTDMKYSPFLTGKGVS